MTCDKDIRKIKRVASFMGHNVYLSTISGFRVVAILC